MHAIDLYPPATINTVIVSPIALPIPGKTAVLIPEKAAGTVTLTMVSHLVVTIEERGLIDAFGEAYEKYRRYVPALIPYKGAIGKRLWGI